jgi:hypothetical protein
MSFDLDPHEQPFWDAAYLAALDMPCMPGVMVAQPKDTELEQVAAGIADQSVQLRRLRFSKNPRPVVLSPAAPAWPDVDQERAIAPAESSGAVLDQPGVSAAVVEASAMPDASEYEPVPPPPELPDLRTVLTGERRPYTATCTLVDGSAAAVESDAPHLDEPPMSERPPAMIVAEPLELEVV